MSIKNIFNTQSTNMKEFYFTIYKVSTDFFFIYKLRQFMTHFKSCTSKMNSMSGVGQCL